MEESNTKNQDKINQALANIDAQCDWIEKMTLRIQFTADALFELGIPCGTKLHDNNEEIRRAAMQIKELKRQIIDRRFTEAQHNSANVLSAALAGIEISKKKGE